MAKPRNHSRSFWLGSWVIALLLCSTELHAQDFQELERFRVFSPYLPDWLDNMPFKFSVNQSSRYNDNIQLLPDGQPAPAGLRRGDFFNVTTPGYETKIHAGGQTFFSDGSYTFTRYANDFQLNTNNYSIDGGVDWIFTSACSGRFMAASRLVQAPFEDQLTFGVNNVKTDSLTDTARCRVAAHWATILETGETDTTNSLASAVPNNNNRRRLRAGLEYEVTELDTLRAQATLTKTDFVDRSAVLTPGLAKNLEQRDYELYYKRIISPLLQAEGTYGQTEFGSSNDQFSSGATKPTYSATVRWTPTPKLEFVFSTAVKYTSPLTIVADFQRIKLYSVAGTYRFSPILSFTASAAWTDTSYDVVAGGVTTLQQITVRTAGLEADYLISPLMNAALIYRFTERTSSGVPATSNLYMASLTYRR